MNELSKSQRKKARRKEQAKAERRKLRKTEVLCLTCTKPCNMLAWKNSGQKCPNCGGETYAPIDKREKDEIMRLLHR